MDVLRTSLLLHFDLQNGQSIIQLNKCAWTCLLRAMLHSAGFPRLTSLNPHKPLSGSPGVRLWEGAVCAGGLWGNAFEINTWGQGTVRAAGLGGQRQREGGAAMWLQQQSLQRAGGWKALQRCPILIQGGFYIFLCPSVVSGCPMPPGGVWPWAKPSAVHTPGS